jgi:hypothetical protein
MAGTSALVSIPRFSACPLPTTYVADCLPRRSPACLPCCCCCCQLYLLLWTPWPLPQPEVVNYAVGLDLLDSREEAVLIATHGCSGDLPVRHIAQH